MIQKLAVTIIGEESLLKHLASQWEQDAEYTKEVEIEFESSMRLKILMDEVSPLYQRILDTCSKCSLHPYIALKSEYTKAEIEKCDLFEMNISHPLELEGTFAKDYGTQYTNSCTHCGLGGELKTNVFVDKKLVKTCQIGRLTPHICVSPKIRAIIEEHGLTGVSFDSQVKDFKGRTIPELYVMTIHNILPPMDSSTWMFDKKECPVCGRMLSYLRSDIQYRRADLDMTNDFNLSTEFFDNYREQRIIVSAKTRLLFRKHRVYAGFFPVELR